MYDLLKAWMGTHRVYCDALDKFIFKDPRLYPGVMSDWFWIERTVKVVAREKEEKQGNAGMLGR